MLEEFVLNNHFTFVNEKLSWQEAIKKSCESLLKDNSISQGYDNEIIEIVKEYGPYIVISPGIAIPHGKENSKFVNKTAISFTKFSEPIIFNQGGEERNASLFFTIASKDMDIHLKNITKLMELLTNKDLVDNLNKCNSKEELIEIAKKYNL